MTALAKGAHPRQALDEIQDKDRPPKKIEIPGELIVRGSVRLPEGVTRSTPAAPPHGPD